MKECMVGLYEKSMPSTLSIKEKLEVAKECGYDYLELSIDETDEKLARLDWTEEEIWQLSKWQHEVGLPVRSICLSGHRKYPLGALDAETQERSMEIMQKAVVLAAKLGVRIIQLAGYDVYYTESTPETKAVFAQNLQKAVDIAARYGVILAFETMETEFLNTVGKAMAWVEKIDSPYLQIYPDSGNITNAALSYKTDVTNDLRSGKGHIVALHLKESKPGIYREVPYGDGHVEFEKMMDVALELGVRMFVTEFWYVDDDNWKEIIVQNRQYFNRLH